MITNISTNVQLDVGFSWKSCTAGYRVQLYVVNSWVSYIAGCRVQLDVEFTRDQYK